MRNNVPHNSNCVAVRIVLGVLLAVAAVALRGLGHPLVDFLLLRCALSGSRLLVLHLGLCPLPLIKHSSSLVFFASRIIATRFVHSVRCAECAQEVVAESEGRTLHGSLVIIYIAERCFQILGLLHVCVQLALRVLGRAVHWRAHRRRSQGKACLCPARTFTRTYLHRSCGRKCSASRCCVLFVSARGAVVSHTCACVRAGPGAVRQGRPSEAPSERAGAVGGCRLRHRPLSGRAPNSAPVVASGEVVVYVWLICVQGSGGSSFASTLVARVREHIRTARLWILDPRAMQCNRAPVAPHPPGASKRCALGPRGGRAGRIGNGGRAGRHCGATAGRKGGMAELSDLFSRLLGKRRDEDVFGPIAANFVVGSQLVAKLHVSGKQLRLVAKLRSTQCRHLLECANFFRPSVLRASLRNSVVNSAPVREAP